MEIAQQLKERSIAEYLIYMWQVEDLIRANDCDINRIRENIIPHYKIDGEERCKLTEWYSNLASVMREEGAREKGHLQINRDVVINLTELHAALLASSKSPFCGSSYFKALPFVVELQSRNDQEEEPELKTCFEALYGMILLRLQKKPISPETTKAMEAVSSFLSMLVDCYDRDKRGGLKLEQK